MSKLTKPQLKMHREAEARLEQSVITDEDREFIFQHWHPGAETNTTAASAFFTPLGLAFDFEFDAPASGRILDACAGIGVLSWVISARHYYRNDRSYPDITAFEANPAYIAIGRKLLPWVTWIQADIFDLPDLGLGEFNCVVSNPPFGRMNKPSRKFRYTGSSFELALIDMLADHAKAGAFIIPQNSAPFAYSGRQTHERRHTRESRKFYEQTGLYLSEGCGVDCAYHKDQWQDVALNVEIVTVDYAGALEERRNAASQYEMAI